MFRKTIRIFGLLVASQLAHADIDLSQIPLFVSESTPPLNMLVIGKDHKIYFPAYNDSSDLDGDGILDIYYKPSIKYLGYFDSYKCYKYNGTTGNFSPESVTSDKTCKTHAGRWSGDFLNYQTTSRLDALRKVLYGGYRSTDDEGATVLERIPLTSDAHTWGKEYLSVARDGYDISDYTPLAVPTNGKYILFANTSISKTPKFRIIDSSLSNAANGSFRIWGWVSREVTQGTNTITNTVYSDKTVTPTYDLTVRVQACVTGLLEIDCKQYSTGNKPTGLLHDYGEAGKMNFGLMTGTYNNNVKGGVLRKAMGTFADEIKASTGQFRVTTKSGNSYVNTNGIVSNLDKITFSSDTSCSANATPLTNSSCKDWGNPIGEIAYEALRYFNGLTTPTAGYAVGSGSTDTTMDLTSVSPWVDPYTDKSTTCSKPFVTMVSDVNPSYDSNLPGTAFTVNTDSVVPSTLANFNVSTIGNAIWNAEFSGTKSVNIGEAVGTTNNKAPTAKSASSFATIRGLPEEPNKEGSYSSAAVAYYGSRNVISSRGNQKVQTFSIALASTIPRLQVKSSLGTITFVPYGIVRNNSVTDQITGFYVDSMSNMPGQVADTSINGGRQQIIFRVVYDDAAQKSDYDMDSIILYTIKALADGTISVRSDTEYSVSGATSHLGYTMSGSNRDGVYIEVTGGGNGADVTTVNTLDTPDGKYPGDCAIPNTCALLPGRMNGSSLITAGGVTRPTFHERIFTPATTTAVTNLENPLWYAAKYGVTTATAWDADGNGVPDNYFLVSNAAMLKSQLDKAFNDILQLNNSVTSVAVDIPLENSTNEEDTSYVYRTNFDALGWAGDLIKQSNTTTVTSNISVTTVTPIWKAASLLSSTSRNILTASTSTANNLTTFNWAALAKSYNGINLQTALNTNTSAVVDNYGQARIAFIRGDSCTLLAGCATFRNRTSKLGDIINSSPILVKGAGYLAYRAGALDGASSDISANIAAYTKFKTDMDMRTPIVYVGANDGMLHAFNATTGTEQFAFVPTAVIPNLNRLTDANYGATDGSAPHQYYVDSTPVIADAYFDGAWHTVLVSGLGAGGREVFALDITDPSSPKLLWEFTNVNDGDLGYSIPKPSIARLHTGEWAVLVPNGYNSASNGTGKAVLFALNIQTGAVIRKLTATTDTTEGLASISNGLSNVRTADFNGDGITDYAYGGDLQGNMWRFDLINTSVAEPLSKTNVNANTFAVSFGGKPLYVARDSSGTRQPITAAPSLVSHPSGTGYLTIFGTGKYLSSTDKAGPFPVQAVYGVWDRKTNGQATSTTTSLSRSNLQTQTITSTSIVNGKPTRDISQNPVHWYVDGAADTSDGNVDKYGWYLDLTPGGTPDGERLVYGMTSYGEGLLFSTITPSQQSCSSGLVGLNYGINPTTGGRSTYNIFDINGDGVVNNDDGTASAVGGPPGGGTIKNDNQYGSGGDETKINSGPNSNGRQTWRMIPANVK